MSMFDTVKKMVSELPVSDIQRARVELALDQSAMFERQAFDLQAKVGQLQAQLDIVTRDRDAAQRELQQLKDEHAEEVCIRDTIEFRRGKRTENKWQAFRPKCHLPAVRNRRAGWIACSAKCGWTAEPTEDQLPILLTKLG